MQIPDCAALHPGYLLQVCWCQRTLEMSPLGLVEKILSSEVDLFGGVVAAIDGAAKVAGMRRQGWRK